MKHSQLLMVVTGIIFGLGGYTLGFYQAGGKVEARTNEEVELSVAKDRYQYLPAETSLEEALKGGHYKYCIAYPGVGLVFDGQDFNGNLVVSQAPLTYPARKNGIFPGFRVSTPLEVLKGDFGSPVKIVYKQDLKEKSMIVPRIMVKKCLRAEAKGSELSNNPADARTYQEQ